MAVVMLNSPGSSNAPTQSLEDCIRFALEQGQLSPALRRRIDILARRGMTAREQTLLQILQDAIQDGCIEEKN
jgi:hypothetical protein